MWQIGGLQKCWNFDDFKDLYAEWCCSYNQSTFIWKISKCLRISCYCDYMEDDYAPSPTRLSAPAPPSAKNIGSFVHPFEFVVSVDRSTPAHDKVTLHVITRSQKLMNNKFSSNFWVFFEVLRFLLFKKSNLTKIWFCNPLFGHIWYVILQNDFFRHRYFVL